MMRKQKHMELLKIITSENDWVTANFVATKMNVSIRSIKNYISEINHYEGTIIESCHLGYRVKRENLHATINNNNNNNNFIPQNQYERIIYIIKRLVISSVDLNMYDLCDEIYVSFPTLKSDLNKAKRKLNDFDIILKSTNNNLILEGTEKNKRKLMSSILYEEANEDFLNISTIQDAFPQYDIAYIKESITEIFNKFHYFINDYSFSSLILHITISLDRIINNYSISNIAGDITKIKYHEYELSMKVVCTLEEHFHVKYNETEIYELYLLLMSMVTTLDYKNIDALNLDKVLGEECFQLVRKIITSISNYYYIDLCKPEFLVRFSLHINNLLIRSKNNYFAKNPLTINIKSTYPFIYDVAVFVSNQIKEETNIIINDDEIAYIALHIGSILEEQKNINNKASCVILCPNYYDMNSKISDKVKFNFQETLVITDVITSEEALDSIIKPDIILSTVFLNNFLELPFIHISPFVSDVDINNIFNKINIVKQQKKNKTLRDNLTTIFRPNLFEKNRVYKNEIDAIQSIADIMYHNDYVDSNFVNEVLERERMSSTAFNNIAIPHSMKMNALQISAYILINDKPFKWANNNVNIVLMLAINKNDKKAFRDIFESITGILTVEENIKKIISCNTYDEFISILISCS